eukprot:11103667-Alexandrium_andersonii.AAC.1
MAGGKPSPPGYPSPLSEQLAARFFWGPFESARMAPSRGVPGDVAPLCFKGRAAQRPFPASAQR